MPVQQHPHFITFSDDQVRQILSTSEEEPRLRDLNEVASLVSYTGIRPGELQNLRWSSVDVSKGRVFVATKRVHGHYVPFGPKALQILEARRGRAPESEYVLGASGRTLLNRVSRQFRALANSIGASSPSLSILRRTFITCLCCSLTNVDSVWVICGHRNNCQTSECPPTQRFEWPLATWLLFWRR